MVSVVPLLLLLLFCCSTTSSSPVARAGPDELNYISVDTSSFMSSAVCKGHRVHPSAKNNHTGGSSWLPLSHLHGPCSPLSRKGERQDNTSSSSAIDALRWDQHRAGYIQRKLSGNVSAENELQPADNIDDLQISHQGAAIPPNLGSPKKQGADQLSVDRAATGAGRLPGVKQTMLLDTASDVAWVQCAPCPASQCYPQTDVLYDPAQSGSSATFPCSSPTCRQLGPYANGCTSDSQQCQYRVQYPDGSTTSGTFNSDLLSLTPTARISGFEFGCSHAARGSFSAQVAGIMALGRGAQSLASQVQTDYGHVFSYCFPPTASHRGFFTLGVPRRSRTRYALTPMLSSVRAPSLYLVRLQAIVVAGQQLNVPPTVFAAGAVLDSRTPVTRLPRTAYAALRDAFRDRMTMYRPAAPNGQLDTCYDFTGVRRVALPKISLVFDRAAAVELDPSGILFDSCLAFASNGDDSSVGIVGYVQLQTIEVLYNVGGGAVGFRTGAC